MADMTKKQFIERLENEIEEIQEAMDDEEGELVDRYMEGVLSIDQTRTFTILLGFGGPNYGFDIHTRQGELYYIEYWFSWGSDRYRESLSGDEESTVWDMFSPYIETELQ